MNTAPSPGLLRRLGAIAYDSLVLAALLMIATALVLPFTGGEAVGAGNGLFQLYLAAVVLLFFGWFWTRSGQTIGMVAWRLRVVREDGSPLSWQDAVVRALAAVPSWLALGAGFWWSVFDRDGRTWHDRLSGTRLVLLPLPSANPGQRQHGDRAQHE